MLFGFNVSWKSKRTYNTNKGVPKELCFDYLLLEFESLYIEQHINNIIKFDIINDKFFFSVSRIRTRISHPYKGRYTN